MRRIDVIRSVIARVRSLAAVALLATSCSSSPTAPSQPPPTSGNPPVTTTVPPTTTIPPSTPALTIACPPNQAVMSPNANPVAVSFSAPSITGGVSPVQVTCTRTSGSLFPIGTTEVQCTATDAAPSTRSCSFSVNVTAAPPQLTRTKFMAFGDSTTAGEVPVPASVPLRDGSPDYRLIIVPSAAYPTQLLSLLRARYTTQSSLLEVVNSAVPSEWAEDGARRLPGVMANVRPHAVLLVEGINDLAALGTPGVLRAWRAIDLMAKEIRGRGARAFIATLPPPRLGGSKAVPLNLIQSLNSNIRDTVRGEGAVLVDLFTALSTDVNRYMSIDGLHPSEAGYQKIADTFYEAIRLDLERR
jgi:lysophospholipase L1-like esterase